MCKGIRVVCVWSRARKGVRKGVSSVTRKSRLWCARIRYTYSQYSVFVVHVHEDSVVAGSVVFCATLGVTKQIKMVGW